MLLVRFPLEKTTYFLLHILTNSSLKHHQNTESPEDSARVRYLEQHTAQLEKALQRGIPIEGYYVWTLLDNFEWAFGYAPESCFGLVHVGRVTLAREKKASFHWYRKYIQKWLEPKV